MLEHWHGGTLTRHSWMNDLYPEALAEINPQDAEKLDFQDGDPVCVSSRRGKIFLRVKISEKSNPGIVFIPFFYGNAPANVLTNDALDPLAKIPEYKSCAIKISPASLNDLTNPPESQKRGRY